MAYHALLGLLSVAGLRVGEGIRLMDKDIDLQEGLLTIRGTKFGKWRLAPIHPSTQQVLQQYTPVPAVAAKASQSRRSPATACGRLLSAMSGLATRSFRGMARRDWTK